MSKHITVQIDRCVGCHTCEVACAIAHSQSEDIETMLLEGENPGYRIHVETYGPLSIPITCEHCEEAPCALVCPTDAVKRHAPGKPVLVDDERCTGCGLCVRACPYGVIALRPEGKVAFKCDLCVHRLAKGLEPACLSSCPTKALVLQEEATSSMEAPSQRGNRKTAVQKLDKEGNPEPPKAPPKPSGIRCYKCDGELVIRESKRGPFLGCGRFPKCRTIISFKQVDHLKQLQAEGIWPPKTYEEGDELLGRTKKKKKTAKADDESDEKTTTQKTKKKTARK